MVVICLNSTPAKLLAQTFQAGAQILRPWRLFEASVAACLTHREFDLLSICGLQDYLQIMTLGL